MPSPLDELHSLPSYAGHEAYSGLMLAHIVFEIFAWLFVLPIGIMFSVSRSQLALPTQFLFLLINALGVLFGIVYNANTPDLYENNAHHKIGWITTWIMTAQVAMALLFLYSGRNKKRRRAAHERAAFLPVSVEVMAQHDHLPNAGGYSDHRWSGDSGQGTERSSYQTSRDISPIDPARYTKPEVEDDLNDDDDNGDNVGQGRSWLRLDFVDKYFSDHLPDLASQKLHQGLEGAYEIIDRTILVLGFVTLVTGVVAYTGIFRSYGIFSGLAHSIKGGIFFWYGLLTLGRWMGCFAEYGWAWNMRPTRSEVGRWKHMVPSAEFVESAVIFVYGSTNVWLEHLAAWGQAWSAQDLEHVSISIMFFGGGLCGMLIESTTIRDLLNTTIAVLPASQEVHPAEAQARRASPKAYSTSMNPLPGLIILLLGIMMSSHQQHSVVATMVHRQWGMLFVIFALARAVTYILLYVSPPTSSFASRPPSELVAAFCLISGGLIFMGSAQDCIIFMEYNNLDAMFIFTVVVGFTAFLMAWVILVLAIRGWAARRVLRTTTQY